MKANIFGFFPKFALVEFALSEDLVHFTVFHSEPVSLL